MESLKNFFKGRLTKPKRYIFSNSGDLVEKGEKGAILETIKLPPYRDLTLSERIEQEAAYVGALRLAEKDFEAAKADLRSQEWDDWSVNVSDIRKSMLAVERADQALQKARFPLMYIEYIKSVRVNTVDFARPNDLHVVKGGIHSLKTRPRTLEEEYVRSTPLPVSPETEATTSTTSTATATSVVKPVLIDEESPLSSWALNDLVVNGSTYPTVLHALLALTAEALGNEEVAERVRATEAPADLDVTPDRLGATEEAWNAKRAEFLPLILEEQFKASPVAAEALLKTGTAPLGYAGPDMLLEIGLEATNPSALDPTKWVGQNLYGKVLEKVRADLVLHRRTMEAQAPVFVGTGRPLRISATAVTAESRPVTNAISSAAANAVTATTALATKAASATAALATKAASATAAVATKAASATAGAVTATAAAAKPVTNAISSAASATAGAAAKAASATAGAVTAAAKPVTNAVSSAASTAVEAVTSLFK